MSSDEFSPQITAVRTCEKASPLALGERASPGLGRLLSAHDAARLTRRPRWVLLGLTAFGRFPPKERFHGRASGRLQSDVLRWLAKDRQTPRCCARSSAIVRDRVSRLRLLPRGFGDAVHTARRRFDSCTRTSTLRRRERP